MVGCSREHQLGERRRLGSRPHRGGYAAFRALGVAHFDEAPKPALECREVRCASRQRPNREPRRMAVAVLSDRGESVIHRAWAVFCLKPRREVDHTGQNGQSGAPAVAPVAHPELKPGAHYFTEVATVVEECDNRLRDNQPDVALEAVTEAAQEVLPSVGAFGDVDQQRSILDSYREYSHIVGPLVEGPAGFKVEARVMPVAGEDAVLDCSAVEWEAHVRAPVVDREQAAVRIEQNDRVTADNDRTAVTLGQLAGRDRAQPLTIAFSFFARLVALRWNAGESGNLCRVPH